MDSCGHSRQSPKSTALGCHADEIDATANCQFFITGLEGSGGGGGQHSPIYTTPPEQRRLFSASSKWRYFYPEMAAAHARVHGLRDPKGKAPASHYFVDVTNSTPRHS